MSHSSGDQQLGISRYQQKKDVNVDRRVVAEELAVIRLTIPK